MLVVSIPNSFTAFALVETATKCCASEAREPCCKNQLRAACALSMVSCVVKVLDAMMKSVVSGCKPVSFASMSWPSTLERK